MAITLGHIQLIEIESKLPLGFRQPIEKKVKIMVPAQKGFSVGPKVVYNTELIFSRVMGLQASLRNINFMDVLPYELAPIPTALFDDSG